ncbi:hypothetical protein SQ03_30400 [Methylobacterium platani JCM 14648]|uniref:Uncharacterized protein n=1 Tax=Methylobacterium platani JCM 14648 TaxID=1295136 RepID=A0ABR5GNM8_9HYPH|nr:hypothetical protein SQ03_30400 [Methylobacterium platani JCM 14648]
MAAAYRAEPGSGPAIACRFGVSPATLRRRARAEGWARDAPEGRPDPAPPGAPPVSESLPGDSPLGDALSGDVLGGHRIVVAQGAALTLRFLDDLQAASVEDPAPDDGSEEGGLARAAILQKRVAALRDLAAAARLWIALERQAWDLDGKGVGLHRDDTARPDPDIALRLLDDGQRAQLRAIAERLAERPAGPAAGPRPAG